MKSIVVVLAVSLSIMAAHAATRGDPDSSALCASLAQAVDAAGPADAPVFVASYRRGADEEALPAALSQSAFVYENALAAIALVACGDPVRATRIADALAIAARFDRTFTDGRIRNAYRAGKVAEGPPDLPGWWDARRGFWAEDAYQDGTATGNVAWAALALLTVSRAADSADYLAAAGHLLDWVAAHAASPAPPNGFQGGVYGYDQQQTPLRWQSTEHNIDVAAAAGWLYRESGEPRYAAVAAKARDFVTHAFRPSPGYFLLGAREDGGPSDAQVALDVQLWPWMALDDAPAAWRQALHFAEGHLAVDGGFDFNGDRDGLWVEGTAQAALAYRMNGDQERATQLLDGLEADRSPSGLLNATRVRRLTTGLSIGPDSKEADFFYFPRPHLGATAWAALAAVGWNPFTGTRVD